MIMTSNLFQRLNKFSFTIYHSDNKELVVWKDGKRKEKLYVVKEIDDGFGILGPNESLLAGNMTEDKVIDFIKADMGIVSIGNPKVEKIIAKAAKKHGLDGTSIVEDLKRLSKTSKTVKKKRKIDVSSLDLEDR